MTCPDCALRIQYRAGDTNATDNQVKPQFNVVNAGTGAVPLIELTLRYWWTETSTSPGKCMPRYTREAPTAVAVPTSSGPSFG